MFISRISFRYCFFGLIFLSGKNIDDPAVCCGVFFGFKVVHGIQGQFPVGRRLGKGLQADFIGFWDADLATPLSEIPRFVHIAADHDYKVVTGLRLLRLGAGVRRKKLRHYLGRCFATAASVMLGLPVYDTQCGAKLYRTEVVTTLFSEKFITRWLFDVEILARYIVAYGRTAATNEIYEHPVFAWEDIAGSRLKAHDKTQIP